MYIDRKIPLRRSDAYLQRIFWGRCFPPTPEFSCNVSDKFVHRTAHRQLETFVSILAQTPCTGITREYGRCIHGGRVWHYQRLLSVQNCSQYRGTSLTKQLSLGTYSRPTFPVLRQSWGKGALL